LIEENGSRKTKFDRSKLRRKIEAQDVSWKTKFHRSIALNQFNWQEDFQFIEKKEAKTLMSD
jgi:hypothetical protein